MSAEDSARKGRRFRAGNDENSPLWAAFRKISLDKISGRQHNRTCFAPQLAAAAGAGGEEGPALLIAAVKRSSAEMSGWRQSGRTDSVYRCGGRRAVAFL